MKIVVAGAGRMGSQIGWEYAAGGHDVVFLVRDETAARARIEQGREIAQELGSARVAPPGAIDVVTSIRADCECDMIVESLPEDLDLKASVLGPLARRWPAAVVATNTSSLRIGDIGSALDAGERTIGTHYWNPPLLMPLVEVVPGPQTRVEVTELVLGTLGELGKRPVVVRADVPGFVWNRLQLAVMREAVSLVGQGVAEPEVVDLVVREGLARRWRHVGPFAAAALGGADTWTRIGANILPDLSAAPDLDGLAGLLEVREDELGRMRAARDAALMAEARQDTRPAGAGGGQTRT